jgi:hypothetical protein
MAPFSLEDVRIASPCDQSWAEMIGDDRVRYCGGCKQYVYNLSELSRTEAKALLDGTEGRTCIRLFRRADGTVLTRDCPEGRREQHVQFARLGSRMALLFGLASGAALVPLYVAKPTAVASAPCVPPGTDISPSTSPPETEPPPVTATETAPDLAPPPIPHRTRVKPPPPPAQHVMMGRPAWKPAAD